MAWSSACRSPCQNLYAGKDELAVRTPTEGSNRCNSAPTATRAPTTAVVPVVALPVASSFAYSSVVKYLEDDLQRIIRTILEARPLPLLASAPDPAHVIAATPHYQGPRELRLKAWFIDIY